MRAAVFHLPGWARSRSLWTLVWIRTLFWVGTAATLLWSPLGHSVSPFGAYEARTDLLFRTFAAWDSGWYLRIAAHGYDLKQASAFFPFYPLIVRGVAEVVRSTLVAGVLVSLVSAGIGALLVGRIASLTCGERCASDSVLLLALYPIAFVFTAVYSEGLFLALAAGSVLAALRGRPLLACACGALAVATRPVGLVLVIPLLILLWPRSKGAAGYLRLAGILLLPAALAAYAGYLHEHFGDAFAFAHAQSTFWLRHTPSTGPIGGFWEALKAGEQGAAQLVLHLPQTPADAEQRAIRGIAQLAILVAALWLTWVAWRRLGAALSLLSLGMILVFLSTPADVDPLVSIPRFLLVDFPLFIALAVWVDEHPRARRPVLIAFATIGGIAAAAFSRAIWVA